MRASAITLGRYPVKSMLGEAPPDAEIAASGLVGDRAWALLDEETGKIASAKHPRLWGGLLALRATYAEPGRTDVVHVTLPDGDVVPSDAPATDDRLSDVIGRRVRLVRQVAPGAVYDELWPDVDRMAPEEFVAQTRTATVDGRPVSSLPVGMLAPGTFQDVAPVTLLTTASLRAAAALWPSGDWDPRRFRPTVLIDVEGATFVEQEWVGRSLTIGSVVLQVFAPAPRCVMVTSQQEELAEDVELLRVLARHNRVEVAGTGRFACLGAYATVSTPGKLSVGDSVSVS